MFFFIFFLNITEIIPFFQMPANARMAVPLFLALLVCVVFNVVGVVNQGPLQLPQELVGVPAGRADGASTSS